MRNSRVLRECRSGKLATCVKINLSDARVIELAGLAGFSAAWICNEHVPGDWSSVEHFVRAAKIHDMDIIVRVSKGSYSDYIKAFECDAAGVMVPHVTSAEEARTIVEMCRFYPMGRRALDGGNVDGEFAQLSTGEYIDASNREKFIILQIESPEAVDAIEEIAAIEGYNFLLFGPGDYSHLIGKAGCAGEPEVLAARERVEQAGKKYGKLGFSIGAVGTAAELQERGYGIVNLGSDVVAQGKAFQAMIQKFPHEHRQSKNYYESALDG